MVTEKQGNKYPEAGDAISPDNPVHTGVTKDAASTPGYFRLFMPGLAARYIFRWFVNTEKNAGLFGFNTKGEKQANQIVDAVRNHSDAAQYQQGVELAKEWGYKGHFSSPESALGTAAYHRDAYATLSRELQDSHGIAYDSATKDELIKTIKDKTITTTLSDVSVNHDRWETFKADVKKTGRERDIKYRNGLFDSIYDLALGIGSTALTLYYATRVGSDIKKVFAETVSYENGKDPSKLTIRDFTHSDNVLVQSTVSNFKQKNFFRLLTDSVFFINPLLKATGLAKLPGVSRVADVSFSDLGVGIKGGQLLYEIQSKEATVFEYLLQLIDNKLNPIRGIGDHIKPSEVIDLYQKWAAIKDPKAAFRDATIYQDHDGMSWGKSEVIFTRVADLLNGTYKYKHPDNNLPLNETAPNFTLPKFLYLLGHNLIDTYQPEKTLAYVEVANRYGIEAVKNMKDMLSRGVDMTQVMQKYPVDIERLQKPEQNAAVVPPLVTERNRVPEAVPISFFPAQRESFSHGNENALAENPSTKIAAHAVEPEKVAGELGEKTRT